MKCGYFNDMPKPVARRIKQPSALKYNRYNIVVLNLGWFQGSIETR